jgi:hypothetical protein
VFEDDWDEEVLRLCFKDKNFGVIGLRRLGELKAKMDIGDYD